MNLNVYLRPEAEADLDEAAIWYEQQRGGLGHEFLDSISAALETIAENPELYPVVHRGIRRALVARFPFGVYYAVEETEIVVIAVIHGSRHPKRWKERT